MSETEQEDWAIRAILEWEGGEDVWSPPARREFAAIIRKHAPQPALLDSAVTAQPLYRYAGSAILAASAGSTPDERAKEWRSVAGPEGLVCGDVVRWTGGNREANMKRLVLAASDGVVWLGPEGKEWDGPDRHGELEVLR